MTHAGTRTGESYLLIACVHTILQLCNYRNIPAALMGRRDFHEKYTALRQSLQKGKDEWHQLCQKMTSHHATATYMATLERPMHKVLATYNELLAGLDEFWWPVSYPCFTAVVKKANLKCSCSLPAMGSAAHGGRARASRMTFPLDSTRSSLLQLGTSTPCDQLIV